MKPTPREPTPEMLEAALRSYRHAHSLAAAWRAMHDAAPSAEPGADGPAPGFCKHCKKYTIAEPLPAEPVADGPGSLTNTMDVRDATFDLPLPVYYDTRPAPAPATTDTVKLENAGYAAISETAERGEYPPDAVIAQCMLAVDDPLLWGRLGENSGDMVRKFARSAIDADRAQRVPLTEEQMAYCIYEARMESGTFKRDGTMSYCIGRAVERAHKIGAKP